MMNAIPRRFALQAALVVAIGWAVAQEAVSQPDQDNKVVVWTAIIPEGFPGKVYTWRLRSDGAYEEDGRDALTGTPIQQTLSGRWTVEGARLILRQDGLRFVFDGLVAGDRYSGTLYLSVRKVSRFCAARGETAPKQCEADVHASAVERPVRRYVKRLL
jgi:hypothetical protein